MPEVIDKPMRVVPEASAVAWYRRLPWRAVLAWLSCLVVLAAAVHYGMGVRRAAWDATTNIRFLNSVSNAIEWGSYANQQGVYKLYDQLIEQHGPEGSYKGPARFALDYAPLRLLIAAKWAEYAAEKFPPEGKRRLAWRPEYEFTEPMLRLNMACELLAMLGIFLLVYHWMRVCHTPPPEKWWSLSLKSHWGRDEGSTRHLPSTVGLLSATIAALLLWFNPALIFNAHAYPQWDAWLLPAFIFAIYFGVRNWWLSAGIVVGVCAMAKGQILFALPLLIAWPLLLGHFAGVVRVVVGVLVGVGLVVWPWVLQSYEASAWMLYASVGAVLLAVVAVLPRTGWRWQSVRGVLGLLALIVTVAPVAHISGHYISTGETISLDRRTTLLAVLGAFTAMAIVGGRHWVPTILTGLPAACLMLTIPLLKSSSAWFEIGTLFPTRNWKQLYWCRGANLGSILQERFGWKYSEQDPAGVVDLSWLPGLVEPVPIRHVMAAVYVVLLIFCVIGFVRQRRSHDPRLLAAMAVPLMLAYTFLPQMIERYLMWPAALLSAYAAMSLGALWLWAGLSVTAVVLMAGYMLSMVRQTEEAKAWLPYFQGVFPDVAWGIIVAAVVMLYLGCTSSGHRSPWRRAQERAEAEAAAKERPRELPAGRMGTRFAESDLEDRHG